VFEAAFILRAFRATFNENLLPDHQHPGDVCEAENFVFLREIPGGQILGPTRDYTQRILDTSKVGETPAHIREFLAGFESKIDPTASGKLLLTAKSLTS